MTLKLTHTYKVAKLHFYSGIILLLIKTATPAAKNIGRGVYRDLLSTGLSHQWSSNYTKAFGSDIRNAERQLKPTR